MRFFLLCLLFLNQLTQLVQAQLTNPEINSVSPDGHWRLTAHWIKDAGYASQLENMRTGKIYFRDDKTSPDNILPREINVLWRADGRYAVATLFYGRALEGISTFDLNGEEPKAVEMPWDRDQPSLDKTLVKAEDKASYTGYNRLLISASEWKGKTDLVVAFQLLAFLKAPKTDYRVGPLCPIHQDTPLFRPDAASDRHNLRKLRENSSQTFALAGVAAGEAEQWSEDTSLNPQPIIALKSRK